MAAFHFQLPGRPKDFYVSLDTLQDPKAEDNNIMCVYYDLFFSNSLHLSAPLTLKKLLEKCSS